MTECNCVCWLCPQFNFCCNKKWETSRICLKIYNMQFNIIIMLQEGALFAVNPMQIFLYFFRTHPSPDGSIWLWWKPRITLANLWQNCCPNTIIAKWRSSPRPPSSRSCRASTKWSWAPRRSLRTAVFAALWACTPLRSPPSITASRWAGVKGEEANLPFVRFFTGLL